MFNNPYMYTRFTPNMSMGMGAVRGASSIPMGMNAIRGVSSVPTGFNAMRGATGAMGMGTARGGIGGLFSRLGGTLSSFRGFNWGGLINNASKTIGVINQTIPLVKQAGPMIRNMRSVMKIASIFKDETDPVSKKNSTNIETSLEEKKDTTYHSSNTVNDDSSIENQISDSHYDSSNSPVFFVN